MSYYKSLSEYVQVLEREGLLFRVNRADQQRYRDAPAGSLAVSRPR